MNISCVFAQQELCVKERGRGGAAQAFATVGSTGAESLDALTFSTKIKSLVEVRPSGVLFGGRVYHGRVHERSAAPRQDGSAPPPPAAAVVHRRPRHAATGPRPSRQKPGRQPRGHGFTSPAAPNGEVFQDKRREKVLHVPRFWDSTIFLNFWPSRRFCTIHDTSETQNYYIKSNLNWNAGT